MKNIDIAINYFEENLILSSNKYKHYLLYGGNTRLKLIANPSLLYMFLGEGAPSLSTSKSLRQSISMTVSSHNEIRCPSRFPFT